MVKSSKPIQECSLRSYFAVRRAAVGQWAGVEDETTWGVMSSVGMSASVAKANDIKWPPTVKRAAVLLCLFKGSAGELRVILTKRAGTLSSHSGVSLSPCRQLYCVFPVVLVGWLNPWDNFRIVRLKVVRGFWLNLQLCWKQYGWVSYLLQLSIHIVVLVATALKRHLRHS